MNALLSELISYLIKFVFMIACAGIGLKAGIYIRENKNKKETE